MATVMTATAVAAVVATVGLRFATTTGLLFASRLGFFAAGWLGFFAARRTAVAAVAAMGTMTEQSAVATIAAVAAPAATTTMAAAATMTKSIGLRFQADEHNGHGRHTQRQSNDISLHNKSSKTKTKNGTFNSCPKCARDEPGKSNQPLAKVS